MYQRAVLLNLPKAQSIDIEFTNVSYWAQQGFRGKRKQILYGVSGHYQSGELTAIIGPSGAGKSTLLNVLTGFQKCNLEGTVTYRGGGGGGGGGGDDGKQRWNEYRKDVCYIQQDDQLYPQFTVSEAMTMAADLKLGNSLSRKAKQMVIDDVLDTLDLTKAKETRCDRLSGGQKKRLSIALELTDNPPVMFLDEPTTGLDSSASYQCVDTLKRLVKDGRTIVCTIHQPSAAVYEMFDHVYLLAEGRCMYQGSASNTVAYFATLGLNCPKYHNPADYVIEVVSKEYGDFNDHLQVIAASDKSWRSAPIVKTSEVFSNKDATRRYCNDEGKATILVSCPSELTKFWVLLNRCMIQQYRDWTVTHLKLVLHFLVGVLLGLMYTNFGDNGSKSINNVGYLLVSSIYLFYTSIMPAILRFPLELPVLQKEQFNNWYNLKTYYAAFLISNLPTQMLFVVVYCSTSYFLSNQPLDWNRFLMFLAIAILNSFTAESVGLIIGTTVNPINGTFLGAILTAVMLAFAGFLVLFNHMSSFFYYVSYFSYLRYSMEGMVLSLYGFGREQLSCPEDLIYCHYRIPEKILAELSMHEGRYWIDIAILTANFIILRFIVYCTLKRKLCT